MEKSNNRFNFGFCVGMAFGAFVLFCFTFMLRSCHTAALEKEAVYHGFGTYDEDGDFTWFESKSKSP